MRRTSVKRRLRFFHRNDGGTQGYVCYHCWQLAASRILWIMPAEETAMEPLLCFCDQRVNPRGFRQNFCPSLISNFSDSGVPGHMCTYLELQLTPTSASAQPTVQHQGLVLSAEYAAIWCGRLSDRDPAQSKGRPPERPGVDPGMEAGRFLERK